MPPINQADIYIPDLYMCADGPSNEIVEANMAAIKFVDEKIVFMEVYSNALIGRKCHQILNCNTYQFQPMVSSSTGR